MAPGYVTDRFACFDTHLYDTRANVFFENLGYPMMAAFGSKPITVGVSKEYLILASKNDYFRLARIELPRMLQKRFNRNRRLPPTGGRLSVELDGLTTRFADVQADDKRQVVVCTFENALVLLPLARVQLPIEPHLEIKNRLPQSLLVGQRVEIDLESHSRQPVQFVFVPGTDFLPREKQQVVGAPRKLRSPILLKYKRFAVEDDKLRLSDYTPLANLKVPYQIRSGRETMTVVKFEKSGKGAPYLLVKRSRRTSHSPEDRIEVVNSLGLPVTPGRSAALGKSNRRQASLKASVLAGQKKISADIRDFTGMAFPFDIQIGNESMTVIGSDDFRGMLMVRRTNPQDHGVATPIYFGAGLGPAKSAGQGLPVIQGNKLTWTPTSEHLGPQTARLRVVAGGYRHEVLWSFVVRRKAPVLPFQVVGLEPEHGSHLAVIWGKSVLKHVNPSPKKFAIENKYFLGIYDLRARKLLKHTQTDDPVGSAVITPSGIYACMISFDDEPLADPAEERKRLRSVNWRSKTMVVEYDRQTLQRGKHVQVSNHTRDLQAIGGKYLVGRHLDRSFRLHVPSLKQVLPRGSDFAGRVKDGWVWSGAVWDEQLGKARLLLDVAAFGEGSSFTTHPYYARMNQGIIRVHPTGLFTNMWVPQKSRAGGKPIRGDLPLIDRAGGLSCRDGQLEYYSWVNPWKKTVGDEMMPVAKKKLVDMRNVRLLRGDRNKANQGRIRVALNTAFVALYGDIYHVPLSSFGQPVGKPFRFVERQTQLVMKSSGSTTLSYSAPGAVRYNLRLTQEFSGIRAAGPSTPLAEQLSTTGTFRVDLKNRVVGIAYNLMQRIRGAQSDVKKYRDYLKQIGPAFRQVMGRPPRGIPVPVFATVQALHRDGSQIAGLSHAYLVEVTLADIKKGFQASNAPRNNQRTGSRLQGSKSPGKDGSPLRTKQKPSATKRPQTKGIKKRRQGPFR